MFYLYLITSYIEYTVYKYFNIVEVIHREKRMLDISDTNIF